MSRCTHNDHPDLEPCKNEGIGEHGYCVEHGCCLCGGVMLADTEDWKVYLCDECLADFNTGATDSRLVDLIDAAYEAGRRSVIGDTSDVDDEEKSL
jgi:hypothetical protein